MRRRVDLWCSCFTVFPTCGGFGGPPSFPFSTANGPPTPHPEYTNGQLDAEYAKLNPPPRGYQDYWRSRQADWDIKHVAQGMTNFFRAFYYMKSADFPGNQNLQPMHAVHSAKEAAEQNARMPENYVMRQEHAGHGRRSHAGRRLHKGLHKWLTEPECNVYGQEYTRSGWTGALQEYRRRRNNSFPQPSPNNSRSRGAQSTSRHRPSWEEKTGAPPQARRLDQRGDRDWRVIASIGASTARNASGRNRRLGTSAQSPPHPCRPRRLKASPGGDMAKSNVMKDVDPQSACSTMPLLLH